MRTSGILLPITSLPSPHGIGTLGQAAYDFIDFLQQAGQTYWQILPLGQRDMAIRRIRRFPRSPAIRT